MYPEDFKGKYVVEHWKRETADGVLEYVHGMKYTLDEYFVPELEICINSKGTWICKEYGGGEFCGKKTVDLSDLKNEIEKILEYHRLGYQGARESVVLKLEGEFPEKEARS